MINPMKTKISLSLVFLVFALSGTCVFAGDAPMPSLRLAAEKIPGCSKAYVCKDLQYGDRQRQDERKFWGNSGEGPWEELKFRRVIVRFVRYVDFGYVGVKSGNNSRNL